MKHPDGKNQDLGERRPPAEPGREGAMGGPENNDPQTPDDAPGTRVRSPRDIQLDRADSPRDAE